MARMIPSMGPADATPESHEEEIYASLSLLPDDYTVIHSFRMIDKDQNGRISQREADFVIFHKQLGILCVESKAGRIQCINGEWLYQNGTSMSHGGPYSQADSARWKLLARFGDVGLGHLTSRCRVNHAVWLPTVDCSQLGPILDGPEALRDITLCKNDLSRPKQQIDRIMQIKKQEHPTDLTDAEAQQILDKVLLPTFDIIPSRGASYDYTEFSFIRLLRSQARVLEFLQDQKTAVINGAAGTGKTLIAIEYAKRCAKNGKVLFLCFNRLLRDDIEKHCSGIRNIEVYTIAGYACHIINGSNGPNYQALANRLLDEGEGFEYDHIIIDEGQDFGVAEIEDAMLLDTFKSLIDLKPNGTMYFFYDRRQFVQGSTIPRFIVEADSKLTLYVNCRNTQKIARSSINSLTEDARGNHTLKSEIGNTPQLRLSMDPNKLARFVDEQITELRRKGLSSIVILTCKSEETSILANFFVGNGDKTKWRRRNIPVHTVRKYKGLEADAVILIDVNENLWKKPEHNYEPDPGILFYTAASRAKHELRVIADMNEESCKRALEYMGIQPTRRPKLKFKNTLDLELIE